MKTYNELNALINSINVVIGNQETKVQKKLSKFYDKIKKHSESYQIQVEELRLDNAAVDSSGVLLLNEKGDYKFNKEGLKKLTKEITELNLKTFEFDAIPVMNPQGLDSFLFLKDWTTGIDFVENEEEEEEL